MTWFESLTGCREASPDHVREHLEVTGTELRSNVNGGSWRCGTLETPALAQLRDRATSTPGSVTSVREVVADVQSLHQNAENRHALFQVASQFNLLEMTSPVVIPEQGVGIYEHDFTQGPACAIAAGAGTIYRNYFVPLDDGFGQTVDAQIDCLSGVGEVLGNTAGTLWEMRNGYALPSLAGLTHIDTHLAEATEAERDSTRAALKIGIQSDTEVTLGDGNHTVTQAYCSALPVSYSAHPKPLWARFATLILEAAYEATLLAAKENLDRYGNRDVYLTLLGGGAFGNETVWILNAIERAVRIHAHSGLAIHLVSFSRSRPEVVQLAESLSSQINDGVPD